MTVRHAAALAAVMTHRSNDDNCIIQYEDMLDTNDDTRIRMLLARFMDGETTLDEERELSLWFKAHPQAGDGLDDYRALFGCFEDGMPLTQPTAHGTPDDRPRRHVRMLLAMAAAAAVAALVILAVPWSSADDSMGKPACDLVCQGASAVAGTDSLPSGTGGHGTVIGSGPSVAAPTQPVGKAPHRRRMTRRKSMHVPPSPAHLYAAATVDSMVAAQVMVADARIAAAVREQDAAVSDMLRRMEEEQRSVDSYMAGLMDDLPDYDDGTSDDGTDITLPANAY